MKRVASDDALGWIGVVAALLSAIILDRGSAPHKWHAAIMWTFVAFFGALIFGRKWRNSWRFWLFWAMCLILHALAMWLIFGRLLPRLILGTLYVIPIAFVEAILLVGIFAKLRRRPTLEHSKVSKIRSAERE